MLFIIIPVFNRIEYTTNCLEALGNQSYKDFRTIVVDDGSLDNTSLIIRSKFSDVILLRGDGNLWWSGATNLGIKYAIKSGAKYILTINNDLTFDNDYLKNTMALADDNSLLGSVLISNKDSSIIDGGSNLNIFSTKKHDINKGKKIKKTEFDLIEVNLLPGRGLLIPARIFGEIGIFEEKKLPQYGADYEFSIRAQKYGYKLYCNYNSIVISQEENFNIKSRYIKLSWPKLIRSFFDMKTSNHIKSRFNFAILSFGKLVGPYFFVLDLARTLFSTTLKKTLRFYQ